MSRNRKRKKSDTFLGYEAIGTEEDGYVLAYFANARGIYIVRRANALNSWMKESAPKEREDDNEEA